MLGEIRDPELNIVSYHSSLRGTERLAWLIEVHEDEIVHVSEYQWLKWGQQKQKLQCCPEPHHETVAPKINSLLLRGSGGRWGDTWVSSKKICGFIQSLDFYLWKHRWTHTIRAVHVLARVIIPRAEFYVLGLLRLQLACMSKTYKNLATLGLIVTKFEMGTTELWVRLYEGSSLNKVMHGHLDNSWDPELQMRTWDYLRELDYKRYTDDKWDITLVYIKVPFNIAMHSVHYNFWRSIYVIDYSGEVVRPADLCTPKKVR